MENMKKGLMIIILSLIVKSSFGQQFVDLKGDYLGQTPPEDTPVVFARGIISTVYQEHGTPAFSPKGNEVFWQTNRLDSEKKWLISVMTMRRTEVVGQHLRLRHMLTDRFFLPMAIDSISVVRIKAMTLIILKNRVIAGVSQNTSVLSLVSPKCNVPLNSQLQATAHSIL